MSTLGTYPTIKPFALRVPVYGGHSAPAIATDARREAHSCLEWSIRIDTSFSGFYLNPSPEVGTYSHDRNTALPAGPGGYAAWPVVQDQNRVHSESRELPWERDLELDLKVFGDDADFPIRERSRSILDSAATPRLALIEACEDPDAPSVRGVGCWHRPLPFSPDLDRPFLRLLSR